MPHIYIVVLINVIHNDFKLADQKTSSSHGHEFYERLYIINNAP